MADPDAPWEFEDTPEEPPAEATATPAAAEAKESAKADVPTEEEFPPPPEELSESQQRKKNLYRHWIRPTFLQYNYIYNYRKNYYDDVINYLDKRNKGYFIDTPRAQTWAERALRTYTYEIDRHRPILKSSYVDVQRADESRLRKAYVNTFHAEHSHNFYHRKYRSVLY